MFDGETAAEAQFQSPMITVQGHPTPGPNVALFPHKVEVEGVNIHTDSNVIGSSAPLGEALISHGILYIQTPNGWKQARDCT